LWDKSNVTNVTAVTYGDLKYMEFLLGNFIEKFGAVLK